MGSNELIAGTEKTYQKMSKELLAFHQKQLLQEFQDLNNQIKNKKRAYRLCGNALPKSFEGKTRHLLF
ncbi:hypothetical protein BSK33_07030 [Geobacillus sp. 44B]|jgi:hypothetical protein|nr:hypothetical protein BSK33_07030 [Geobacillus sp. 44B]